MPRREGDGVMLAVSPVGISTRRKFLGVFRLRVRRRSAIPWLQRVGVDARDLEVRELLIHFEPLETIEGENHKSPLFLCEGIIRREVVGYLTAARKIWSVGNVVGPSLSI